MQGKNENLRQAAAKVQNSFAFCKMAEKIEIKSFEIKGLKLNLEKIEINS